LAVALLLGSLPAMADEQPSVWPKDIYSAEENPSPRAKFPGDDAEAAPSQTVDLTNSTSTGASSTGIGRQRQGAGHSESRRAEPGGRAFLSAQDKSNGAAALSVRQSMIPFGYTGRRRSHRAAATRFRRRGRLQQKSPRRAAILRAAWAAMTARARSIGTGRDRSPGRSIARAKQARHLAEQVGDAE